MSSTSPALAVRSLGLVLLAVAAATLCGGSGAAIAQVATPEPVTYAPAESPLKLVAVEVQPEPVTPETLCRLAVTLKNTGDQPISGLRFAVSVNGHAVPVYHQQVFLEVVPPGGEAQVPLYNFWVTETGRPLPEKGPLSVEVWVTEARWTKVELEPADPAAKDEPGAETIETWTLLEPLAKLPDAVTVTRELRRP